MLWLLVNGFVGYTITVTQRDANVPELIFGVAMFLMAVVLFKLFCSIIFMFVNVYENVSINKKTKDRMEESKSKRNSYNQNIKYRNAEK